ncbi:ImmA/IrrE family metallo-endopeptidase [Streptomyces sp. CAI-21]|uniref:ImmA/IrrE family metallo-endopeptidase n=1 Tax=Streptomyces sp. CAI-21 TaxID=1169743 RepID=UPI00158772B5|nr:ImmA/IrrE family metallo-endopeptidase [Streptomyces sp. CAI-21]
MSAYEPWDLCVELDICVRRIALADTWGAWIPQHQAIVLARGLNPVQERCVLAHQAEHALANHTVSCGLGPFADQPHVQAALSPMARRQDRHATIEAARKLIPLSELAATLRARARSVTEAAFHLRVTPDVLCTRIADLQKEGWPWRLDKSKIAG